MLRGVKKLAFKFSLINKKSPEKGNGGKLQHSKPEPLVHRTSQNGATWVTISAAARLESGQTLPSTKTLLRYAKATGSKFHMRLSAA